MQAAVTTRIARELAVITIDNPPVNALGQAVRAGLMQAIGAAAADPAVRGIVLACAGRTFVAGADITELGKALEPALPEVIAALETCGKPSVAALHGTALGGGFELALGCTWRVARTDSHIGLPEVKLGLLPGAGGTVRATTLCGGLAALDLIGTGRRMPAPEALGHRLVDALCDGDPLPFAIDFLTARIAAGDTPQRPAMPCDMDAFEAAAAKLLSRARSAAPRAVVEAIRNALTLPADAALRRERALFLAALDSPVSAARRHLFFAERRAAGLPADAAGAAPRPVESVGVVGAGTMGAGIAMAFANAGFRVTLTDTSDEALARGLARIAETHDAAVARGTLDRAEAGARRARITASVGLEALAGCDLIVEAAFEDMGVKQAIFAELDRIARPEAVLATNTSYLDVNTIAAATRRPGDVVGLHFFSPAQVMTLLEIVRGAATSPEVLATALAVARRMGKQPVIVGVCRGFVGNRMLAARNAQLGPMLLEGAEPAAVDTAFRDFGWPMGPFEMQDMAGLDISWRNRKALGLTEPVADALCEAGRFGQKAGAGWYAYPGGGRRPVPDPAVKELVRRLAAERGIPQRAVKAEEIIERTHGPMVDEGRRIVEEGIAASASDIDVVWTHGYGFPGDLGGPMFWARNRAPGGLS